MSGQSLTSHKRSATIKVGLLTLVSIGLLIFCLVWLRGRGLAGGSTQEVLFKDVDGMREGASVQMMGIRVGFIDSIRPYNKNGQFYVQVKFTLNQNQDVVIPRGSRVSVEQSGIIGEKFLEISPPQLQEVSITTFKEPAKNIAAGLPVRFLYEEGYLDVGRVERVEKTMDGQIVRHKLSYRVTRPGAEMPEHPVFELTMDKNENYYLMILPKEPFLAKAPDPNLVYTIENPLRIKRFLEIQMESAEALKLTNDKINQLLSDDTIDTLNNTLKNTEVMTARATEVLDSANSLFQTTGKDLEKLVKVSSDLAVHVTAVSKNLNDVIGDPQLKSDIMNTVTSINQSTKALNEIIKDPSIKETLTLTKETTKNAAELLYHLKKTAQDKDLQERLDTTMTLLNGSLNKLSVVLDDVKEITNDDDKTVKGILEDTRDTAANLKTLSEKFNKRFALFRLMF